jgi:PAS domain S-box-containing protein
MGGLSAVVIYGVLVTLWASILVLYARHRRAAKDDPLIQVLLGVLALDAFKSLVESAYFGLVWGGNYGVLPPLEVLSQPWALTCVKLLNVAVAVVVLSWLIRWWLPTQLVERRAQKVAERVLREQLQASLEETRQSEERLRHATRASRDAVWDWNARTGQVWFSDRMSEMLGFTPAEWSLPLFLSLCHQDDFPKVAEAGRRFAAGELATFSAATRARTKQGQERSLSASAVLVRDDAGVPLRIVGFIRDLTDEQRAEVSRAQAQKLEGLGLLAGGIAHDFNNLLAVISTSLSLAEVQLGNGRTGGELRSTLTMATSAVDRAATLTRQLLAYAGRARLTQQQVDLNAVVGSLSQLMGVTVPRRVTLTTQLAERLPRVVGDEGQLQQVVMNLITNAAEAIGEAEGMVTLTTRQGPCEADVAGLTGEAPRGECVVLQVRDTGGGMSPEVRAHLFDPFFSTKGSGRGLGLAALVGILKSHQGAIRVQSAPGQGTTFTVYLPVASAPDVVKAAQPVPTGGPRAGLRVLMVDDEPMVRRGAARLLTHLGCIVEEAENGQLAVDAVAAAAAAEPFDAVLMDVTMPVLSGYQAARVMRERWPRLQVVLSSGFAEPPADGSMPQGVRFLPKPYDRGALEALLAELREAVSA